jgi:hypothetical protein
VLLIPLIGRCTFRSADVTASAMATAVRPKYGFLAKYHNGIETGHLPKSRDLRIKY